MLQGQIEQLSCGLGKSILGTALFTLAEPHLWLFILVFQAARLNGYCDNLVNRTEVTTEGCAVIVPSLGKSGCLHASLTNSASKGKTALLQVSCVRYFPERKEETALRAAGAQVHRCRRGPKPRTGRRGAGH